MGKRPCPWPWPAGGTVPVFVFDFIQADRSISDILSLPQLEDASLVEPALLSFILTCFDLSRIFHLGDIFFSHVKALMWDASRATSATSESCRTSGPMTRTPKSHPSPEQDRSNLSVFLYLHFLTCEIVTRTTVPVGLQPEALNRRMLSGRAGRSPRPRRASLARRL